MSKQVTENKDVEKLQEENPDVNIEVVEIQLYDFMNDPYFQELEFAHEYLDYFLAVKQDTLIKIDGLNYSIMNAELELENFKSDIILDTDFKGLYGKYNERVEKAHIQKECGELISQIKVFKNEKSKLSNQLSVINDMIKSNQLLISEPTCNCNHNHGEGEDGSSI